MTRPQIRGLGLGDAAISAWIARGRLHRVHQGVLAVGHTVLGVRGHWMAAVLACGPGAALSHASAAALRDIRGSDALVIDVTARRTGRKRPGIRIHRPRTPAETTTRDGIPVTTPARTIRDFAANLTRSRLEHLLDQAEIRELTDYPALDAIARADPRHRRARRVEATLAAYHAGDELARSDVELLFRELCRTHDLPTLGSPSAFADDRAGDVITTAAGCRTLRFTDRRAA